MSRRRAAEKRPDQPDAKYGDPVIGKFINAIMRDGKKFVAERIMYDSFSIMESKGVLDPKQVLYDAISNVKPALEVRSRRVGGATYHVPIPVAQGRSRSLGIRWLVESANARSEKTMEQRLAMELMDANNKAGTAIKKRETTHKMAEANKAFAHFRW